MKSRIKGLLIGATLVAGVFIGGSAVHPNPAFAKKPSFHCHNLNRIDYWVVTGIDSENGGIWCVGSAG